MIYTLGHSTRPISEFIALLRENQIHLVADVRTIPRSRHNPQFDSRELERSLKSSGIRYRHFEGLGGLRKTRKDSPNKGWHNESFRGYADYMQTPTFQTALAKLIQAASKQNVAIVCAEAVPWRCHRNLIADALVARGFAVGHILGPLKRQPHRLTPWIKVRGSKITYPSSETRTKPKTRKAMPKAFNVGDRVSWNSEAGRVRGRIIRKITRATRFKGYTHRGTPTDPQYMIEGEKTGHIALHRGSVLRKLKKLAGSHGKNKNR